MTNRSILVARTALGLGNLQLWQSGKYILPEGTFGAGEMTQRRITSESPMVAGRYASSIVEGQRFGNISVHVLSPNEASLQSYVQEVITAMTQFRYTLAWQWRGLSGTWQCEKADWALGETGILHEGWLKVNSQAINFTVPHRRVSGF